jgi:hypothetical protein
MKRSPVAAMLVVALVLAGCRAGASTGPKHVDTHSPFAIHVVDAATGRGVPLVELKTTNDVRHYTDSNGLVAFDEPGLMNTRVFFAVSSPGYEVDADGFGMRGVRLDVTPGGSARVPIKRINIAERLYRVTGQGIYADTLLLGRDAPTRNPALNARVMGQDSVYGVPYRDRIYWFWGDTNRPDYPLGNFAMSGATSHLPKDGGLDPAVGVDLEYFTDATGFVRGMAPLPRPGLVWVDGVAVVHDTARRRDRMIGSYERLRKLGDVLERGIVVYDDSSDTFKDVRRIPLDGKRLYPRGHAMHAKDSAGVEYVYFAHPYPIVRVRNHWEHVIEPTAYEAFTCLKPGAKFDKDNPALDRDASGKLVYAWKRDTDPVGPAEQDQLIKAGKIKPEEAWLQLRDVESKEPVFAQNGTVAWNAYRKRYVMIFTQYLAKESLLGEIWYAEADAPEGPWRFARKVATHPNYSFYNPCHHPFFDQDGGRVIYFEGTYTAEFSGAPVPTPRYNYNQIMYRLDLSDARLQLP